MTIGGTAVAVVTVIAPTGARVADVTPSTPRPAGDVGAAAGEDGARFAPEHDRRRNAA